MAVETLPRTVQRSLLERSIDLSRVNLEVVAYVLLVALSVIAHLWGLGNMALHHDESIHAWTSWRFYTGAGSFTCWGGVTSATYCYDPVYHGPSLYVLTLISYFLFGDGDAQARLPMALAGIVMVASCWWLRPYLGRRGAFIAAVLLGFSPSLLYYTRFARHDGLMVLWELWMVIGVFRYLDSGRPAWLYLMSAAMALAIATHELYYILFFIFGIFVLMRLLAESRFVRYLNIGLLVVMGLCLLLMVINPPLPIGTGLYFGEKAFLVASALLLAWLCQRLWSHEPILTNRLKMLWQEDRRTLWIALAILAGIYLVLYTTFFSYPRGAIDGLYAGLAYWLGSQQDYARGDQPWYYYLMQLPLYEPLGVLAGIGMVGYLIKLVVGRFLAQRRANAAAAAAAPDENGVASVDAPALNSGDGLEAETVTLTTTTTPTTPAVLNFTPLPLFPLLLVFWYFTAVIIFSWAGEKMPWLTVHMSLPGNLLAAWVLAQLSRGTALAPATTADRSELEVQRLKNRRWLVPLMVPLLLVTLGVALWRFQTPGAGQEGQSNLLQGLVPLLLGGGIFYLLLTLAQQIGTRVLLALTGLTVAALLGAYMIRATWLVVYEHPDTPIDPLIYVQSSPDVPRYASDIRELAINLTRTRRSSEDIAGGLSMPIIIDNGDPSAGGEGSLAWPLQWYLRDFRNISWRGSDQFRNNPSAETFEVTLPDNSTVLAPVVLLSRNSVTDEVRNALSENYVLPYGESGVFNWWFPEGDKCSPNNPGYKRFYYSSWTPREQLEPGAPNGCAVDISDQVKPIWAPLVWPFQGENWNTLYKYLLYREVPYPLELGSRTMQFWLRKDLAAAGTGVASSTSSGGSGLIRLVAQQQIAQPGDLNGPTGIAVDREGNIYIADTLNHRIQIFDSDGNLVRTMGGFGSGAQQFFEPRGVAVDSQGNLYVADTWNARIVKYSPTGEWLKSWGSGDQDLGEGRKATITDGTPDGNASVPLGFFGPRGLAIDEQDRIYIADTGNKRIVVTDNEGNFLYQWGFAGSQPGAFNEPTGVGVDAEGNVYVSDSWNGRVQVFQRQADGKVSTIPAVTWRVSGWRPNTYDDPSITASPQGQVYVSVPSQQLVLAANLRGDIGLRWGGAGEDLASLNSPSGIAVGPDGSVYVVDRQSGRVLRFMLPQILP